MTKPILVDQNELTLLDSGIWTKADAAQRAFIDYTDGDSTEARVRARVEAAADRTVFSDELDRAWEDWALEYHLGSRRSNIYRGLNLKGVKTVLEVGCGCGAITRYLGEQGFKVDAIEGTPNRAEIARLRTSDLENVQIVCSNYHELVLPEASYDLVVFTGVLEYSGAYAPEGVSPEAQLKLTLQYAQAALSPEGQILIAIENRTGFKYLAGAREDHLNVPNIGLYGYREPQSKPITRGIRTWTRGEWRSMLDELDFAALEFCYPFPDYKVPDAILSEHFLNTTRYPDQVLGGIHSRDYAGLWESGLPEALFWRTAAQTGTLNEYANSFLIVVSNAPDQISQTIDFDFVRFASVSRKLAYRLQ
ncbi:MAG: class I SAM-dependent methyltransferase, partial [Alcanivorax sp.]|nr:class I SAM-dependent methyltransferase [Alcanivorax sp.]